MISLPDTSGTIFDVQIFDTAKIDWAKPHFLVPIQEIKPVLIVMDYAFEQTCKPLMSY
jgi:hypothetical protein